MSRPRRLLPYAVSVAAVALFAFYVGANAPRFRHLLNFSPALLLSMLLLVGMVLYLNGLLNYYLYRTLGVGLGFKEAVGLAAINTLANQLPFAGGIVAKGLYLKRQYRLPYLEYFSATAGLYVFSIISSGLLGLATLLYMQWIEDSPLAWPLLAGFLGMTAVGFLFAIPLRTSYLPASLQKRLAQVLAGWQLLQTNPRGTLRLFIVQLLLAVVFAGRYWVAFRALSQEVTLAQCLLFSAATTLTQLVNITPGGLGVREGIVSAVATIEGYDPGVSVVAVGIDRLVATTVMVAAGVVASYFLSKQAQPIAGRAESEPAPPT